MAQELETDDRQEKANLQLAVSSIASSPALRLFFRRYLSLCGLLPLSSPFAPEALEMARRSGMMQAGTELVAMLNAADPLLWPALQIEDAQDV